MFDHERNKDLGLDGHSQNTHQYPLSICPICLDDRQKNWVEYRSNSRVKTLKKRKQRLKVICG